MKSRTFLVEVENMAINMMNKTFTIRSGIFGFSKDYNMVDLGWKFRFNDISFASGQCQYSSNFRFNIIKTRNLYLSEYLVLRIDEDLEWWRQVMLHEIAHAIDVEMRGKTDHSGTWEAVCKQIGNDGSERKNKGYLASVECEYTMYCESCGWEEKVPVVEPCVIGGEGSCTTCAPEGFSKDYLIKWRKIGY